MQENTTHPLRVAQILGKMNGAGIEQVVMNYYGAIDSSKIQFDFFIFSKLEKYKHFLCFEISFASVLAL